MITNIDEFERTKPKETYKAIQDLEECVQDMLNMDEKQHPNCMIEVVMKKVKKVKETFLKGE